MIWTILHCLGLGHETMVCAVCLFIFLWVRPCMCTCLVTWFCYQMTAKPGHKTGPPLWPDPYIISPVSQRQYTLLKMNGISISIFVIFPIFNLHLALSCIFHRKDVPCRPLNIVNHWCIIKSIIWFDDWCIGHYTTTFGCQMCPHFFYQNEWYEKLNKHFRKSLWCYTGSLVL